MVKSNEVLLIESAKGNELSFSTFYERNIKKIYSYIYYKTLHRETAEDLTSLTFTKVLEAVSSFNPEKGTALGWIYRIAYNAVIDHYRKTKPQHNIDDVWDLAAPDDIEMEQIDKDNLELIQNYLSKLPPDKRDVVILRTWQNHSFKEISQIKEMSEAGCKMLFYRTIQKMQNDLGSTSLVILLGLFTEFITGGLQ